MRVNWTHVLIALAIGAVLMHLYRTKMPQAKRNGQ